MKSIMRKDNNRALFFKHNSFPEEYIKNDEFYINREINKQETQEKKILLKSKPIDLSVVLTKQCNLRCIMCGRIKTKETTLPLRLVKKIFNFFPYFDWIEWQGGEVFLVDYFKELFLTTAKYPQITQHITTNGLLIDKDWADLFARSNVELLYSIDGVTKEIYEFIRNGAKFEDLIKSLEVVNRFKEKHGSHNKLKMNVVVMKYNYKTLHLFPDFCRKFNFSFLRFSLLWPNEIPEEDIFFKPEIDAIDYLSEVIPQVKAACEEYNIIFECKFESRLKNFHHQNLDKGNNNFIHYCIYPWTRVFIGHDGDIKPACECALSLGNLKDNSIEDIWNGSNMQLYRHLISRGQANNICSELCLASAGII